MKLTSKQFWNNIILKKDKSLNKKQVYKELSDYYFILQQIPEIYCRISNGQLSKPMYSSSTMIDQLEDNFYDKDCTQSDMKDMIKRCDDIDDLKEELKDYFEL